MAKKKSVKKTSKKKIVKSSKKNKAVWTFVNIVLFGIFLFGIWRAWQYSWTEGLSITAGVLLIWLVIELIREMRKK